VLYQHRSAKISLCLAALLASSVPLPSSGGPPKQDSGDRNPAQVRRWRPVGAEAAAASDRSLQPVSDPAPDQPLTPGAMSLEPDAATLPLAQLQPDTTATTNAAASPAVTAVNEGGNGSSASVRPIPANEFFARGRPEQLRRHMPAARVTLESEAVFFTRLEWQSRIEAVRESIRSTRTRLEAARKRLNLAPLSQLHRDLMPKVSRAMEEHELALRSLAIAIEELRNWHERKGPEARLVAAGRMDPMPLYMRVRRAITAADSALAAAERSYRDARDRLEQCREELAAVQMPEAAKRLCNQSAEHAAQAAKHLTAIIDQSSAQRQTLESILRDFFPSCQHGAEHCQRLGLERLEGSEPAVKLLEATAAKAEQSLSRLDMLAGHVAAALRLGEEADAAINPEHKKLRAVQEQAVARLNVAEQKLDQAEQQLTGECGEERVSNEYCLRTYRVRKVMEPTEACALAAKAMGEVKQLLTETRELLGKMESVLKDAPEPSDPASKFRRQQALAELEGGVRSAEGELAEAIRYAQLFAQGEFEHYKVEIYPREPVEPKARQFAPTVAFYAARQTWYYAGYFDDPSLERDGSHFGLLQPAVSYGKFLVDLAMVPYRLVSEPPWEPQYTLRYHRPGDPVPHIIYLPKWNPWAAAFEGTIWALALTLIP